MAVQKLTPPLGAFGIYKLKAPWVTTANVNYRCVSLRRVEEVVKSGKNIHDTFYAPVGLSVAVSEADIALGVVFVGLLGTDGSRIYVPDTYIESYPDQSAVTYDYTVISIDLGPQPSNVDLTATLAELKQVAAKFTGISPTLIATGFLKAQSNTVMTQEQYIAADDARKLAIANIVTQEDEIKALQLRVTEQDILIQQLLQQ